MKRRDLVRTLSTVPVAAGATEVVTARSRAITEEWTEFQFDSTNSGSAPSNSGPIQRPDPVWTVETEQVEDVVFSAASGVVADGHLVIGGEDGRVRSIDAAAGTVGWEQSLADKAIQSAPAVEDGLVYVGVKDGTIRALDLETGAQRWKTTLEFQPGHPTVDNTRLYVSDGGTVFGIDRSSGRIDWQFGDVGGIPTAPAVRDGLVFVGAADGVFAFDAAEGSVVWRNALTTEYSYEAVSIDENSVYTLGHSDDDGRLFALDAATGGVEWTFDSGRGLSGVANDDQFVYARTATDVYAVEKATGDAVWTHSLGGVTPNSECAPVVTGDALYVGLGEGSRYIAIDKQTGEGLWSFSEDVEFANAMPAVAGQQLYFESGGTIFALGSPAGETTTAESETTSSKLTATGTTARQPTTTRPASSNQSTPSSTTGSSGSGGDGGGSTSLALLATYVLTFTGFAVVLGFVLYILYREYGSSSTP